MRHLIYFASFLLALASGGVMADVQAPLTDEHWQFIYDRAPIIVQPSCKPTESWLCPIDYDDNDPRNNLQSKSKITEDTPARLDIDYIEHGIDAEIIFQLNRPSGSHGGHDAEALISRYKKDRVGSSFVEGLNSFTFNEGVFTSNAHGAPLYAAGSQALASLLGPDYSNHFDAFLGAKLSKSALHQASANSRVAELWNGRPVVLSDNSNALVMVTDLKRLSDDFNSSKTVIFVPSWRDQKLDVTELTNDHFNKAKIVYYKLGREWSSLIKQNSGNWMALYNKDGIEAPISQGISFETLDGKNVTTLQKIGREYMTSGTQKSKDGSITQDGVTSGANPWIGWTDTAVCDQNGNAISPAPTHWKKDSGTYPRIDLVLSPLIIYRCFNGYITEEEKAAGGMKIVRHPFMMEMNDQ